MSNIFQNKRDLSDQSEGGDERKKVKEESSASSTDDTDVFGEGLESADCKAILFNCLKYLEVKVKEIFDLANTTNENQIKGEQQLKCLTGSVKFTSARFDVYEADRKKKNGMIHFLEEEVLGLTEKFDKLSFLVDREIVFSYMVKRKIKTKIPIKIPEVYNFIKKETLAQVFSCEFCEISKNTFFHRTPLVAATDLSKV